MLLCGLVDFDKPSIRKIVHAFSYCDIFSLYPIVTYFYIYIIDISFSIAAWIMTYCLELP